MNIIFFHNNGIEPTLGGISRITNSLVSLFRSNNDNVWLVGWKNLHNVKYDSEQFFPSMLE